MPYLTGILLAALAAALTPSIAWADTGTTVDLTPILQPVVAAVLSAVGAVAIWALKRLADRWGLDIRQGTWDEIEDTIQWAVTRAEKRAKRAGKDLASVDVQSEILADTLDYVVGHVPDALQRLGVTRKVLEEMVEAWLPDAAESADRV